MRRRPERLSAAPEKPDRLEGLSNTAYTSTDATLPGRNSRPASWIPSLPE
jgi:hypothetical protein